MSHKIITKQKVCEEQLWGNIIFDEDDEEYFLVVAKNKKEPNNYDYISLDNEVSFIESGGYIKGTLKMIEEGWYKLLIID